MSTAKLITYGPWQIPVKVLCALCPDGIRRTARITGQADTWFSIPARVKAKGRTVAGYVTGIETTDGSPDYAFRPYLYRKNHVVFTEAPGHV